MGFEEPTADAVNRPSGTALVPRLAEHGPVGRAAGPHDRRAVVLTFTVAGGKVPAQRRAERTHRLAGPRAGLPDHDARRIADALPALFRPADALRRPAVPLEVPR